MPFGLTEPGRTADEEVMDVAPVVVAVGGAAVTVRVKNMEFDWLMLSQTSKR